MDYNTFKKTFGKLPIIQTKDILSLKKKDRQIVFNQLGRWQTKGFIVKLKRGVYVFNEDERKTNPEKTFIANQLYAPSYVSLEYALSYYDLIPEAVFGVTSVTTKKTISFKNPLGKFSYQHIRPCAFRGFKIVKDLSNCSYFLATPEKAIVDFIYLNLPRFNPKDKNIFEESYRFQNLGILKVKKLKEMTGFFENTKLTRVIETFCDYAKGERAL